MNLLIISDVHGRTDWNTIVAQEANAEKVIFLGDYFDSFDIKTQQQLDNFKEIIAFKEQNPNKVILLTGNHDLHYLPYFITIGERYSGFQSQYAYLIGDLIQTNLHHLQMAYREGNYLFTHAGVTNTWLANNAYDNEQEIATFLNELFVHQPAAFRIRGSDFFGNTIESSPVWVRPESLMKDAYEKDQLKQVVGHTVVKHINIVEDKYFFVDAQETKEYVTLSANGYDIHHYQ
jgi:predicted phosphodiesterase